MTSPRDPYYLPVDLVMLEGVCMVMVVEATNTMTDESQDSSQS